MLRAGAGHQVGKIVSKRFENGAPMYRVSYTGGVDALDDAWVAASVLKPYPELLSAFEASDKAREENVDSVHEVEAVVRKKGKLYEVKWKDWSEEHNSWRAEGEITQDMRWSFEIRNRVITVFDKVNEEIRRRRAPCHAVKMLWRPDEGTLDWDRPMYLVKEDDPAGGRLEFPSAKHAALRLKRYESAGAIVEACRAASSEVLFEGYWGGFSDEAAAVDAGAGGETNGVAGGGGAAAAAAAAAPPGKRRGKGGKAGQGGERKRRKR